MNFEEFQEVYKNYSQKQKITINCNICGKPKTINKEKAQDNIKKNGCYIDRSCAMKEHHKNNPPTEATKQKQSIGRKGKKHTEKAKKAISDSKIAFYKTEKGQEHKKLLAKKAVKEHGSNKINKSKTRVLYISAKNNNEIRVCGSSYEYVACEDFWEVNNDIISYETQVSYCVEGRQRSADVVLTYFDGRKELCEIKPRNRIKEEKHISQILDAKKFADQNGWKFRLLTEKHLNIKKQKEAKNRADEYRKVNFLIDYASYREQKNRDKANRYYEDKISKDKVLVYCEYCKVYHSQLRITYEKNIKKNGRFICIYENGAITGKKPKKKKENPYADIGKKLCLGKCGEVLPFDCFGKDKSRSDGHSDKCKKCRREKANENYKKGKENEGK